MATVIFPEKNPMYLSDECVMKPINPLPKLLRIDIQAYND
jgi:hypothetical protein